MEARHDPDAALRRAILSTERDVVVERAGGSAGLVRAVPMASLGADGECPFSGRPLDKRHPYHLTYKAVIEHAARLARREEKADGDDEALWQRMCTLRGWTTPRIKRWLTVEE